MRLATRLGMFALVVGVVFAGAYWAGGLVRSAATASGHDVAAAEGTRGHGSAGGHDGDRPPAAGPGGLAGSADGYTMRQVGAAPQVGVPGEYAFQVVDVDGTPVTRYQTSHDKPLHLIVVRRDLTGFQHLHPQLSGDGIWRTPLTLTAAGDWRVFADFLPVGRSRQVILGLDLPVAGDYRPQPLPAPAATASVDSYAVRVDGHLAAGRTSTLTLTVAKNGAPVTDLQPHLGAYGHLVVLRAGDLAYLHVHPQGSPGDGRTAAGPAITFEVEVPTAGLYRLLLDFQHAGVVHTAQFTATAG